MVIIDPQVVHNEEPPQYSEPYQLGSDCRLVHDENATLDLEHARRYQGYIDDPLFVASRITIPAGEQVQVFQVHSRKINTTLLPVEQKYVAYRVSYLRDTICNLLLDEKNDYLVGHDELRATPPNEQPTTPINELQATLNEEPTISTQILVVGQVYWLSNSRTEGLEDGRPVTILRAPKASASKPIRDFSVLRYTVAPLTPRNCQLRYITTRKLIHEQLSYNHQ